MMYQLMPDLRIMSSKSQHRSSYETCVKICSIPIIGVDVHQLLFGKGAHLPKHQSMKMYGEVEI